MCKTLIADLSVNGRSKRYRLAYKASENSVAETPENDGGKK